MFFISNYPIRPTVIFQGAGVSLTLTQRDEDLEKEDPGLRKQGKAKEGGWAPQVVVALAVTRDVTTVKKIRADLRGWRLSRAMFVADSGMNSEDNRTELSRACSKYILATRMVSVSEVKKTVLSKRGAVSSHQRQLES